MKKNNKKILVGASALLCIGGAFAFFSSIVNNNKTELLNNEATENNSEIKNINNGRAYTGKILERKHVIELGWDKKTDITLNDWRTQAPNVVQIGLKTGKLTDFVWPLHSILRSIEIPRKINILGDYAFYQIASLQIVNFEENSNLASVGWQVITGTSVSSIVIPRSVRKIEFSAFRDATSLRLLTFQEGSELQFIGQEAIRNTRIASLYIPNSVNVIDDFAFASSFALAGNDISMPLKLKRGSSNALYGFTQQQWNDIIWRGIYQGSVLTRETVALLGWDRRKRITLLDWEAAPNVNRIGNGQSSEKPFANNSVLQAIIIPHAVTTISDFAFSGLSLLNDISFESNTNLVTIGSNAFSQSGITKINVPNSVKTISTNAFLETWRLEGKNVSMPIALKGNSINPLYGFTETQWNSINWKIDRFMGTILTTQDVISLGWDSQRSITLEDWKTLAPNVTRIKEGAFSNNVVLQSISIPDLVTVIENKVFNGTTMLQGVHISMSVKLKKSSVNPLYGFASSQWDNISWRATPFNGAILTKEAVVALGWDAEKVITPEKWARLAPNVTQIGPVDGTNTNSPFASNTALESISIPNAITSISNFAFSNTIQLKHVQIEAASRLKTIGDEAFANSGIIIFNIPDSVTTIGANTFAGTASLQGPNISMSVKMKAGSTSPLYGFTLAQWNSLNLRIVQFTNSILTREAVFSLGWDTKTSISLTDWADWAPNVTQLGDPNIINGSGELAPFSNNATLRTIQIPSKVIGINFAAFYQSTKLEEVFFESGSKLNIIGSHAFKQSTVRAMNVPSLVTQIGDNAFEKASSLKIINFESQENLTTIGTRAFWDSGITSITVPDSVTQIRTNAFLNTTSLVGSRVVMSIKLQASSTSPLYGFTNEQWNSIRWLSGKFEGNVLTRDAVVSLGWDTRSTITLNDWITFAPNVTQIGDASIMVGQENLAPFSNNSTLELIEIPPKITSINFASFYKTTKLKAIKFVGDSELLTIANNVFMESTIATINIPKTVTTIGSDAFANSGITEITLPASLTTLGNFAFSSTGLLKTVIFDKESQLKIIGNNTFANSAITAINIPDSVTQIRTNAFANTNSLKGEQVSMKISLQESSASPLYGFTDEQWKSISWRIEKFTGEILTKAVVAGLGWNNEANITLDHWKNFAPNIKQIGISGTAISDGPFANNNILQSIHIPSTITLIGGFAFANASSLTDITFEPNSTLSIIGNNAFLNLIITTIEIPDSVSSIANDAFENNLALNNVTLSYSLFKGGDSSAPQFGFTKDQWDNLNWNNIPTSDVLINSIIARYLLKSDNVITWNEISSYRGIQSNAFSNTNITSIIIEDPNFLIEKNAFLNTKSLNSIEMNLSFKNNVLDYGFTQTQISEIIYLNKDSSISTTVIITSTVLSIVLVVLIAVSTIIFVKHSKNKEEHSADQYALENNVADESHYIE